MPLWLKFNKEFCADKYKRDDIGTDFSEGKECDDKNVILNTETVPLIFKIHKLKKHNYSIVHSYHGVLFTHRIEVLEGPKI